MSCFVVGAAGGGVVHGCMAALMRRRCSSPPWQHCLSLFMCVRGANLPPDGVAPFDPGRESRVLSLEVDTDDITIKFGLLEVDDGMSSSVVFLH